MTATKTTKEIDPVANGELDKAADGLADLLARVLAERHVAAHMSAEKEKNSNP